MKVLKYGGSSVASPERIRAIGRQVLERVQNGERLSIVFSAFEGVTDGLIECAHLAAKGKIKYVDLCEKLKQRHLDALDDLLEDASSKSKDVLDNFEVLSNLLKGVYLVREASPRTMDYILSFGERNSTYIISEYFQAIGVPATYLDARHVIKTNKEFGKAKVNFHLTSELIESYYSNHESEIVLVTGFIASDVGGLTTTLGRGGSDYTAAILAGSLDAETLEIWTDVDGVLTSNPKIVTNAYTIPQLSYDEAMELSHFGAKVIYPPTIQPALNKSIPIFIKNTFNPQFEGTLIAQKKTLSGKKKITGVTSISDIALVTLEGSGLVGIPGTSARLFSCLGREKINIILITQASSEHSICLAIKEEDTQAARRIVEEEFAKEIESSLIKPVKIEQGLSMIAVIGENMKSVPGVSGSLFKALGNNGINVVAIAQGSSELNISFAIKNKDEKKALNLVHDAFFLSENRKINIYLMGVGLIGGTLLEQINDQKEKLIRTKNLVVSVNAIANSSKMLFDVDGLSLQNWKSELEQSETKSSFREFIDQMVAHNLANSIFIDCTANHEIKDFYPQILSNNISVSTANKVAASDKYVKYRALHELALKHNVHFMYETNVGAGLPVLSTLEGMVKSGDQVKSIEAVISGSLSYIFNNYEPDKSFKELILEAREKGYTEPDPRDDLSGQDIKRKLVILSRVAGLELEQEDVTIQPILPKACMEAESVDEFLKELDNHDKHFRDLIENAHKESAKLRYVASLVDGSATIKLEKVFPGSPFYNLDSTDNLIVLHTTRYKERPMVIQGPGAGANVTAAGVFAEIIQLGSAIA